MPSILEPNQHYSVTLTSVDSAGNETPAPGPPLEIVGPGAEGGEQEMIANPSVVDLIFRVLFLFGYALLFAPPR